VLFESVALAESSFSLGDVEELKSCFRVDCCVVKKIFHDELFVFVKDSENLKFIVPVQVERKTIQAKLSVCGRTDLLEFFFVDAWG